MWDANDSAVVCRQLGLSDEGILYCILHFSKHHLLLSGTIAVEKSDMKFGNNAAFPFLLDDVGCNGLETNLLDCLPHHNCRDGVAENAGVQCLRKGIDDQILKQLI